MKLSNFKFKLPDELIAQFPSRFRDDARLLVVHAKTGEVEHKMMNDLASYFDEGDIVIANDTKVFPARLYAQKEKTLANIEVFLLRELQHENRYWARPTNVACSSLPDFPSIDEATPTSIPIPATLSIRLTSIKNLTFLFNSPQYTNKLVFVGEFNLCGGTAFFWKKVSSPAPPSTKNSSNLFCFKCEVFLLRRVGVFLARCESAARNKGCGSDFGGCHISFQYPCPNGY